MGLSFSKMRQWAGGVCKDATLTIDIEETHGGTSTAQLFRQFGLLSVILFTITQAVGSGIMTTPGTIMREYAGPLAWKSFLYATLVCFAPALCLARRASLTAKSGSTGSYASKTLGQLVGLLMFVDVMLECIGGTAAVAVSQSDHITMVYRLICDQWLGIKSQLPVSLTRCPEHLQWLPMLAIVGSAGAATHLIGYGRKRLQQRPTTGAGVRQGLSGVGYLSAGGFLALTAVVLAFTTLPSVNLLSAGVVAVATYILTRGVNHTKFWTNAFTALKMATLAVLVGIFAWHYNPANLALPVPADLPGPFSGASVAFFALVGIDLATTMAGETKDPKRNIPMGMMIGLACVAVLYQAAAYFLAAAVPYTSLVKGEGEAAPMMQALEILNLKGVAIGIGIASTVALFSVVLASAYSTTRLMFNMAQHGMLPKAFEQVNQRGVPIVSCMVVGFGISALTAFLNVEELMHLTNIGTMTAFCCISLVTFVSTIRETNWKVGKQALIGALWLVIATVGMVAPGRLMMELPLEAFIRLVVVWVLVVVLFVTYSRHHSIARKQHEDKK